MLTQCGQSLCSVSRNASMRAHLAEVGVNFKDVTDKLEADGVAAFIKSWDSVLSDVQAGIDRVNG